MRDRTIKADRRRNGRCIFYCALALSVLAMSDAQAQPYRGPITDSHAHVRLGEGDAIARDHQQGIAPIRELDVASGVTRSALIVIARGGPEATRAQNDALLVAVATDPDHFYPVASVRPQDGQAALDELTRLAGLGVQQIKLHPNTQQFDVADPAVAAVTQRAGELGMAVLFDCFNPFDPAQFGKLLQLSMQQPNTRFVLAHMNFTDFRDTVAVGMLRRLGGGENIYFDLSAIAVVYANSPLRDELVWSMRTIGMDRFVFGSDWPVDTPAAALRAIHRLGLSETEEQQVLHDNISNLIELR